MDMNKNFEGKQVLKLEKILEDLVLYCSLNGEPNAKLKLTLPKTVLDRYTQEFYPLEKVYPEQNKFLQEEGKCIRSYHTENHGCVQLEAFEDSTTVN